MLGLIKNQRLLKNVSKITYKQRTSTILTEGKIIKYLYISIDDIGTNLWTPRTHNLEVMQ